MSHAREIKEKQKLQALFQTAHAETTSKISSWLKPKKTKESKPTTTDTVTSASLEPLKSSHHDFLNLPIISGASGLSFTDESDNVKIGEYLTNGNKKKANTSQTKQVSVQRNDSKILEALRNKMKKNANKNIRNNQNHNQNNNPYANRNQIQAKGGSTGNSNNTNNHNHNNNNNNDSDDEEEVRKTVKKKSFGLLIDSKINKKKK